MALGEGVADLKIGDRVAIEAGVNCKSCRFCKCGRYNLCTGSTCWRTRPCEQADNVSVVRFASSAKVYPHADGTLQHYVNHPTAFLHPISESCTYEQAALIEPLSVVIHAARRAGLTAGQSLLILGAGAVGLLGAALADAYGATHIACADINEDRVQFAVREGFVHKGHTLQPGSRPVDGAQALAQAKEKAAEIITLTAPSAEGFDIVLECTGVESCMQIAIHVSSPIIS